LNAYESVQKICQVKAIVDRLVESLLNDNIGAIIGYHQ